MSLFKKVLIAVATGCLLSQSVSAAFFEDADARTQINVLNEKVKNGQKAIIDLNSANESLKQENAILRGRIEELEKNLNEASSNLKSYYSELNDRLKVLEPKNLEVEGIIGTSQPGEKAAYDVALLDFQEGRLKDADQELSAFVKRYPSSPYSPLALYWLANAKYAGKDYTGAIATAQDLIKRYPEHQRVPQALLTIANCQIEGGKKSDGKKTLESVISKYPDTKAAKSASDMLPKIK